VGYLHRSIGLYHDSSSAHGPKIPHRFCGSLHSRGSLLSVFAIHPSFRIPDLTSYPDLSFWYQYKELATRAAIFFSMSTLAGAFNGLIAYAITKNLNGKNGWLAWRWIFLVEGILPIGASFFVLFLLPGSPASTRIGFSAEEKKMAIARSMRSHNNLDEKLNWKKIHTPLISLGFWMMTIIACCGHFCVSSFANFLPAIVNVRPPASIVWTMLKLMRDRASDIQLLIPSSSP
jgi:hypothetical protein